MRGTGCTDARGTCTSDVNLYFSIVQNYLCPKCTGCKFEQRVGGWKWVMSPLAVLVMSCETERMNHTRRSIMLCESLDGSLAFE